MNHRIAEQNNDWFSWEKDCPVECSNSMIKASVFKSTDEVIISVSN
jgi:hypothetical protein